MSALSKTYTFVAGTPIESAEANQNFDDVVNYVNAEAIVRDASKAFTAIPSGPATDPTTNDQLTRKKYVDDKASALQTSITNLTTTVTTNNTNANTALAARATVTGYGSPIIKGANIYCVPDSNGEYTYTFPEAFPNQIISVCANPTADQTAVGATIRAQSRSGFVIRFYNYSVNSTYGVLNRYASVATTFTYIAIGN